MSEKNVPQSVIQGFCEICEHPIVPGDLFLSLERHEAAEQRWNSGPGRPNVKSAERHRGRFLIHESCFYEQITENSDKQNRDSDE